MSEAIPGLPAAPMAPVKPKDAAVTVLVRRARGGVEVFWVRRERTMAFAPGFYAFPGGRVDRADALVPVAGAQGDDAVHLVAAARELFEETGVLLAQGAERLDAAAQKELRRALLGKHKSFGELLSANALSLRASDFVPAGRWITPPFLPLRFDARFFLVEVPAGTTAEIAEGEHVLGEWITPAAALAKWQSGVALLHPPNLHALQVLASFTSTKEAAARLAAVSHAPGFIPTRIEFQQGILLYPLITPTLPPATHTNAYVLGNGELLIVDPGAAEVRQYARLLALVTGLVAEGRRPKAVVVTHHHQDHIGGALAVKERLKIPLWCHPLTANRLPPASVDRLLEDGQVIELSGLPPMRLRVLHTPGHARGHICLVDEASKAAVVGDMVAGTGTIVIDPPEGDMTDYLEQLRRLKELPVTTLYPAHGSPLPDGPAKLEEYLRHRQHRERKVVEALLAGASTLREIVAKAYDDTPELLHPIAERSAQAILIKLGREQKVTRKDDRYFLSTK